MDKRRVRLNINGVVCGLITGESEEYMQVLADEVGDMMKQIMDASPFITREAAALTAALSICDDCHKNAELAAKLRERCEELEVEAELWQEEKVELLKSAVDTQKDAQLAEKAARLSEKASRLELHFSRRPDSVSVHRWAENWKGSGSGDIPEGETVEVLLEEDRWMIDGEPGYIYLVDAVWEEGSGAYGSVEYGFMA